MDYSSLPTAKPITPAKQETSARRISWRLVISYLIATVFVFLLMFAFGIVVVRNMDR